MEVPGVAEGHHIESALFVIFGATGDLARRKLFPALYNLSAEGILPSGVAIVGVGRRPFDLAYFREKFILPALLDNSRLAGNLLHNFSSFAQRCYYFSLDLRDSSRYRELKNFLDQLDWEWGVQGNRVFYLALAPELFGPVVANLKEQGFLDKGPRSWKRVLVEKPFGWDLDSARALNRELTQAFPEEDIYRIDHYLGKEMIQNIMVIRFANAFFEPVWNNKYIDHIQITSSEKIGVGERAAYYDRAGALRDMLQNHMLQLVALIAMEPPVGLDAQAIRLEKAKVFRSLQPFTRERILQDIVRGQYGPGYIDGEPVPGYREEAGIPADSVTETFLAVKLFVNTFRWAGVPFYLRTGKRLPAKVTEIIIQFKPLPEILYFKEYGELLPNVLVIRVQPLEGIFVQLNAKRPGTNNYIVPIRLDFCQNCGVGTNSPEAYERLLYDALRGDATLFTGWEEVEYAWKFVDPIAQAWATIPVHFPNYAAGEWGPPEARVLIERDGRRWWESPAYMMYPGPFTQVCQYIKGSRAGNPG
ncbi:glucose-6-phosphate dehydrogenase [Thermanaeromonas toyohensis]|uniref:glucose-6-phosphate dehydrogenase n=1 Tax=Thermanaeromonas toyohensis TaxID=161154 RepID=UPI0009FEC012|nr:glucose-6-phosphate dehydrogenase [Thermanaeromonas toyohensis]